MIAVLKRGTTPEQASHLLSWLKNMGLEVHNNPSCALCDGMQSLTPEQFRELNLQVQKIREVLR